MYGLQHVHRCTRDMVTRCDKCIVVTMATGLCMMFCDKCIHCIVVTMATGLCMMFCDKCIHCIVVTMATGL